MHARTQSRGTTAPLGTVLRDLRFNHVFWIGCACLWLAGMTVGLGVLFRYQSTPGAAAAAPLTWPVASSLPRPTAGPVLIQVIHPRCACSRASLAELQRLLEQLSVPPRVLILFVRPQGVDAAWERSGNWERAKRLAGATVVVDEGGTEAARFGAQTSGQTLLYGADGGLLFSGGITAARGETGANAGSKRLHAILAGHTPDQRQSAVFGCPLHDTERKSEAR